MPDTAITSTLDRERQLDVRPHLLELERVTGVGVGRLTARVIQGEYSSTDLTETVRLALIGGGATPAEALALSRTYVADRPLKEGHALATEILLAAWNGTSRTATEIAPAAPVSDDLILDATGPNPVRVDAGGVLTPVRREPDGAFVPVEAAQ